MFPPGLVAEGDLYFTVQLQNYTAIEKDEVVLSCELSKAAADVKWFKDGHEIYPSKNILLQSEGKKHTLVLKKAAKNNMGTYTCDCGTDKTTAVLNIEGKPRRSSSDPSAAPDPPTRRPKHHLCPPFVPIHPFFLFPVTGIWMFVVCLCWT